MRSLTALRVPDDTLNSSTALSFSSYFSLRRINYISHYPVFCCYVQQITWTYKTKTLWGGGGVVMYHHNFELLDRLKRSLWGNKCLWEIGCLTLIRLRYLQTFSGRWSFQASKPLRFESCFGRCYTFGIGQSACRRLMTGLAAVSKGTAEFLAEGERLQPKVLISNDMFILLFATTSYSECHRGGPLCSGCKLFRKSARHC